MYVSVFESPTLAYRIEFCPFRFPIAYSKRYTPQSDFPREEKVTRLLAETGGAITEK